MTLRKHLTQTVYITVEDWSRDSKTAAWLRLKPGCAADSQCSSFYTPQAVANRKEKQTNKQKDN